MPKTKAVFFDFDGVIHNTFNFHLENINNHYGVSLTEGDLRGMHDGNFYKTVPAHLEDVDWSEYAKAVRGKQGELTVHPEIKEALKTLSEQYVLFLVTSGFRLQIEDYLRNNDISKYFTDEQYREDSLTKREKFEHLLTTYNIAIGESVFVTDTCGDVLEADEVGLRSIAVTFGYHSRERLMRNKPFATVDSWDELLQTIEKALLTV